MKKPILTPILGIFLTVFFDLLSFGLFIPDLQLRGKELSIQALGQAATEGQIGFLTGFSLAIFSLTQLITSPMLGRLSDRIGRRKILLFTTVLSVLSYVVYAHADSYWIILLSRALSGVAAANLGVAFAYVADVTKPEERSAGMGAVGAAFGLGFVLGPGLGAYLLYVSHNSAALIGYVGAAMALVNLIYVYFLLPESHSEKSESNHFFADLKLAFTTPGLNLMIAMFFAISLGFTNLESTFFILLADKDWIYHLGGDARQAGGILLVAVGVVMVIMQGFVVRKLTPKYGELKLVRYAYLGYAPSLAIVPFLPLWIPMLLGIIVMGTCNGLAQPSLSSLISKASPKQLQGGVFGVTQALGALARCIGPIVSNPLFAWKPYAPYLLGALIVLFPALLSWKLKPNPEM